MANVGGGAAYQRLQVPEDGINQSSQFWGAQDAKRVEGQKLADERKAIRDDQEVKDWEKTTGLKADEFTSKYTGFKSFDDMNTDFSLYITDEYVNLQRQAKDSMLRGDQRGRAKAEGDMIKYKGYFKEASKSQEHFSTIYNNYKKAVAEGRVSGASKNFESIMQSSMEGKNVALRVIDGNLVYTGIDTEGKPFRVPSQDIMDESFGWIEKQDLNGKEGIVQTIVKDLGKVTEDKITGYKKTTTQGWDEKLHGGATDIAIEALTSADDTMGDLLHQLSGGKTSKRKDFTEEDYKLVKDSLRSTIRGAYSTETKIDENNSKYTTDVNARLERQRIAAAKLQPKKTEEELAYGTRKWNIEQVRDGKDTTFFDGHTYKWEGIDYTSLNSSIIGNDLVIKNTDGSIVRIPKNNETGLNDLFNAFEGKILTFDKVQSQPSIAWREARAGEEGSITGLLSKQYSASGTFIGDEVDFVSALKNQYPHADIKVDSWKIGNHILVNGEKISLSGLGQDAVEQKIRKAVGTAGSKKMSKEEAAAKAKADIAKYSTK